MEAKLKEGQPARPRDGVGCSRQGPRGRRQDRACVRGVERALTATPALPTSGTAHTAPPRLSLLPLLARGRQGPGGGSRWGGCGAYTRARMLAGGRGGCGACAHPRLLGRSSPAHARRSVRGRAKLAHTPAVVAEAPIVLAEDAPSAAPFERRRFDHGSSEEKRKRKVGVAEPSTPGTDEPSTPDMPSRRPRKHWCKVCNKKFLSGKALGGHMSCHRHAGKQPKSTPSPPAIVVDLPVLLLGPSDERPSPSSLESQCLRCSKVFSSCQSPRGNMGMHSEKKLMAKPDEEPEPAGLMEAWANANGDHGHNVMLFSPVKRKRSKRGMPVLNSEKNAAAALLMLAEHSDKTSADEDCCGGDKDGNISTPMVLKEVNLNAFEQLDQSDEFTNSARLKSDKNPAYEGFYEHCAKENSLNLPADAPKKEVLLDLFDYEMDVEAVFMKPGADISVEELKSSLNFLADAPKKEVLLNVFDHGMDVDAEFMKPRADISVEEKSSDLSSAMNIKRHQCKVCGKSLRSGQALGGHMTLHLHFEKKNKLNSVADVPKDVLLNAFDHEVDADIEFMTPGAAISVELESSDISAAVNVKKHQCKVCGKLLGSGRALGGHMRLHYVRKCNLHQDVADCPDSVMMEEQMQKLELDSPIFYRRRPHSHGRKSDSEP